MALVDLTLKKGQLVLTQTLSAETELDNSPFLFGTISSIASLSDMYLVGDNVLFNPENSTKFSISGNNFYLTTEDKVYWKETVF